MEVYRKTRSQNMGVNPGNSVDAYSGNTGGAQGLATLVTMIAVLVIILLFCFWSAPGVKDFCRRNICCICPINDPAPRELSASVESTYNQPARYHHSASSNNETSTSMPTIVLLPFGRMLVVDRSIFAQMEADDTGLDFLELSASVIRAHHNYLMQHDPEYLRQHQQNLGRSDDSFSKTDLSLSQMSVEYRPPTYEEIFGYRKSGELPPSYSEANLLLRQLVRTGSLNILQSVLSRSSQRSDLINTRSFSTRTVNDSILIHYESERRLPLNNRRLFREVHAQQQRSTSLDEEALPNADVQRVVSYENRVMSLSNNISDSSASNCLEGSSVNFNCGSLGNVERSVSEDHHVVLVNGSSEETYIDQINV